MAFITLEGFSGISPRTGPALLAANQAQLARNIKLQSGELRPWRQPVDVYTTGLAGVTTIYKLINSAGTSSAWLEWTGDVNVASSPVADTTDARIYYTGDGAPKKTNWNLATTSGTGTKPFPDSWYYMGVPNPTGAPTLVKTGGSGTTHEDRVYVYTYVSTFGSVLEESGPSPTATISTVEPDATITVSGFATAPTTAAGYNITAIRIYRSVYGNGTANYLYVGTVSVTPSTGVASGSFADTVLAAALGVPIPSLYFSPPPSTLSGLVSMPNGILAGFTGNEVWFCEPYLPHAWPSNYTMTVGAPIVGLGVFGQTLVVCTTSHPYLITGSSPGAMSQEKLPLLEPCVSKKSIVGDQYGVLYASPNGLVSVAPGGMDVISRPLMTRDEWQQYVLTDSIGLIYQNMYLFFTQTGSIKTTLVFMRGDSPPLITLDASALGVFVEKSTANIYVVDPTDSHIYQLDADTVNNLFFEWTSKKFIMQEPTNFAVMKVQADWTYIADAAAYNAILAEIIAANQAAWTASGGNLNSTLNRPLVNGMLLNGSILTPQPPQAETRNVQVLLYGDGTQLYSASVVNQEPMRVPASSKPYIWEVKITGNSPVRTFRMATSITELRGL
jgi:hypothetical protein